MKLSVDWKWKRPTLPIAVVTEFWYLNGGGRIRIRYDGAGKIVGLKIYEPETPAPAWNPAGLPPVTLGEALDEARHEVEFGPRRCGIPGCVVCREGL